MRRKRAAALARRQMQLALPQTLPVGEVASITVPVVPQPVTTTAQQPVTTVQQRATMAQKPSTTAQPSLPAVSSQLATTVTQHAATGAQPVVTLAQPPAMKPATVVPAVPAAPAVASAHTVSNPTVLSATSMAALKPKTKVAPLPGQMNLAVVAMSRPNPAFLTSREQAKMLAGVNVADLRRIVIDRMVVAGGWVTNDFVREVNGGRVFVVTARTPKDGRNPEKAWTFYFTEVSGRIYGLTTDSAVENSERMTVEAERFITNLRSNPPAIKK